MMTEYYEGRIVIRVFGSNRAGRHGKGYALVCKKLYGAIYGQGVGKQGNCYGIPTKDGRIKTLPLDEIKPYVDQFIQYAKDHREYYFKVSKVGCGLAGYNPVDIAPFFREAKSLPNVELHQSFIGVLVE